MTNAVFKYFKLTAIFVILIENIAPVSILLQMGMIVQELVRSRICRKRPSVNKRTSLVLGFLISFISLKASKTGTVFGQRNNTWAEFSCLKLRTVQLKVENSAQNILITSCG
jgi:hypothetical protein